MASRGTWTARTEAPDRSSAGTGEIEAELDRAAEMAGSTALYGISVRVLELRTELAEVLGDTEEQRRWLSEAEGAYRETGAIGHAERVARELGS